MQSFQHHTMQMQFRLAYLDQKVSYKNPEVLVTIVLVLSCSANTQH